MFLTRILLFRKSSLLKKVSTSHHIVPEYRSRDGVPLFRVRYCDKIIARCVLI